METNRCLLEVQLAQTKNLSFTFIYFSYVSVAEVTPNVHYNLLFFLFFLNVLYRISTISNQLFINLTDLIYLDLGNNLIGKCTMLSLEPEHFLWNLLYTVNKSYLKVYGFLKYGQ